MCHSELVSESGQKKGRGRKQVQHDIMAMTVKASAVIRTTRWEREVFECLSRENVAQTTKKGKIIEKKLKTKDIAQKEKKV